MHNIEKSMLFGIIFGTIAMALVIACILALVIVTSLKKRKSDTIGFRFEAKIKNKMIIVAKNFGYKYLNGGLFKYAGNQQFELDGVLISDKAVFIIETKYYQGHLSGSANDSQLSLSNKNKEVKFSNPLMQNFKHIQHVYKMSKMNFPIFSLIILPTGTTVDIQDLESWAIVTTEEEIANVLESVNKDMAEDKSFTSSDIRKIVDNFNDHRSASLKDIKKFGKIVNSDENKQ